MIVLRGFLIVQILTLGACSADMQGVYLSKQQYARIYEEAGQLLLELRKVEHFTLDDKPQATLNLRREGDEYRATMSGFLGDEAVVVTRADDGILLVGAGKKMRLTRVDPRSDVDFDVVGVASHAYKQLVESVKEATEGKLGSCGSRMLSKRKRVSLARALDASKLIVEELPQETAGAVIDKFDVAFRLKIPLQENSFEKQKTCTKKKASYFSKECVSWATKDFLAKTKPVDLPIKASVLQSRFPVILGSDPAIRFLEVGGTRMRGISLFSKGTGAPDALCTKVLRGEEFMAYSEQVQTKSP